MVDSAALMTPEATTLPIFLPTIWAFSAVRNNDGFRKATSESGCTGAGTPRTSQDISGRVEGADQSWAVGSLEEILGDDTGWW